EAGQARQLLIFLDEILRFFRHHIRWDLDRDLALASLVHRWQRMRVVMTSMFMLVTFVIMAHMFVLLRGFRGADDWLFFSGFGSRFDGVLGLLFGDCQWITFRYFRWRNGKPLV